MTTRETASTGAAIIAGDEKSEMSRAYMAWDQEEKGYLTDTERLAKNMDVEGKGYLSREQAVLFGSKFQTFEGR
jgi:hypothetical protein